MSSFKVHIIHVGNMANKGTQALLMSDVKVIKEIVKGDVIFSVSTTDVDGTRRLNLPFNGVMQPMVDIPYEKADAYARRFGYTRRSIRYKLFALASLLYMFVQIFLSAISAVLIKAKLKAFYRQQSLVHIKDCNVVVSCSDENFKESASLLPPNVYWIITWWSMLISRTWEILVAKFLGKPVVMFPNSVGPFRTVIGRSLSKIALNYCDFVLIREPISYEIAKSLNIRSPKIMSADTALLLDRHVNSQIHGNRNLMVGVSPGIYSHSLSERKIHEYILAHAEALDKAVEKHGFSVIFLPHYVSGFPYDDLEICKLILDKMKNASSAQIAVARNVKEFMSKISQMDMIVSSKKHPAVLAASAYVPTVCVAYDHKQTGFFMSLDMSECVISITDFSCEGLLSKIDYVWNNIDGLSAKLRKRVPELQELANKSMKLAIAPFIKSRALAEQKN